MPDIYTQSTNNARPYKFRRLVFTLGLVYALALNPEYKGNKILKSIKNLHHHVPTQEYLMMIGTMETDPSLALANATDFLLEEQNMGSLEESFRIVENYASASQAINDNLALTLASITAFDNLLHSEEFEGFRTGNYLVDVRQFKNAVIQATLALDFDRTIYGIELGADPETGRTEIIGVESGGLQQIAINELQLRLVAGRWAYHMNNVMTKYPNDPEIVINGELTDTGTMLALVEFANWSNIFRVISEVEVFKDPNITNSVTHLMNTQVYEIDPITATVNAWAMEQLNSPDKVFEMFDYNTVYPGSALYDYLLQVHNGALKPHKSILALKLHPAGNIDMYIMNRSLENIINDIGTQSNQANYYLNEQAYASRLSDFQRSHYYKEENEGEHDPFPLIAEEA